MDDDELFNTSVAGQLLTELLPDKTVEVWSLWLRNNRNQSRPATYRVPFEKISNGAFYRRADLVEFAEWQRAHQLGTLKLTGRAREALDAFGIGTAHGSATGKRLEVTGVTLQADQATGARFVQMITGNPLQVFRVELDAALALGKDMTEAATAGIRQTASAKQGAQDLSNLDGYRTVTKNATMTIQRLKP